MFDRLPAFPPSRLPAPRAAARGYTLAALMVFVTLVLIGLTAGFQLWSNRLQRENEDELIFRGKQYVEALRLFQQRWGRPPTKLKELMEIGPGKHRCIRQLWKDPITNSDKWGLIFAGGVKWPAVTIPGSEGTDPVKPGSPPMPGQPPGGGLGTLPGSTIEIKPFETTGIDGEAPAGPIIGVFSTSTKESLRAYNGRRHYCEWEFSPMVGTPGAAQGGRPLDGGQGTGGVEQPPK